LASAYDYDTLDDDASSEIESSSKGSFAYLDYADDMEADAGNDHETDGSVAFARTSISNSFEDSSDVDSTREQGSTKSQRGRNKNANAATRQPTWGKRDKEQVALGIQRNRRRRYGVCCELLISSSELLLLDKGVARGFLPMLSRILVPKGRDRRKDDATKSTSNSRPTSSQSVMASSHESPSALPWKAASFTTDRMTSAELRTEPEKSTDSDDYTEYDTEELDREDVLRPFLESMTPGSGFRCLSMLLLQHLLTSKVGYDARIRHVLKKLGVIVLLHDMGTDPIEKDLFHSSECDLFPTYREMLTHATRKFESLERSVARRLIRLSKTTQDTKGKKNNLTDKGDGQGEGLTKEKIMRGLKIGSAGVVAGTLFAVTGGLAAPQIAMGVSAFLGSTAVAAAAVSVLTHAAVVSTIFGVGGGGLAAYKMQRRTQGLTEFEFRKESGDRFPNAGNGEAHVKLELDAELFTTVCISGWLRDNYDYQRPWGLHPSRPRLVDRLELLERFYSIHRPDHLPNCQRILADWKGEEKKLWSILREKYGSDPDHLFPLSDGPRLKGGLNLDQEEALDAMFVELGLNSVAPEKGPSTKDQRSPFERMRETLQHQRAKMAHSDRNFDSEHGPSTASNIFQQSQSQRSRESDDGKSGDRPKTAGDKDEYEAPKHLATVWDYSTTYGGELYTVRWESRLLKTICDCVMDLAMDVVSGATREILKATILSTLLTAVVLPTYLLNVANMIDGDWTLAVERADQAGEELARSLLLSRAGQRPVTLIGFSFGARIIYACLKELAKLQEEWEDYHEMLGHEDDWTPSEQRHFSKLATKFKGMREPSSIVEDAVMMGLPNHLSLVSWKACRQVVGGRLVNCYSTKDLILSLMFQAKRFSPGIQTILKPVCGTCEVNEPGVENFDVSDIVLGHQDYCLHTGRILARVRLGEPLRQRRTASYSSVAEASETGPLKQLSFAS
jgi:Protein of unknown function (DUF726)